MGKREDLKIRLQSEQRIYDDSPNVTVTYKDLSRFTEVILEIIEDREISGFKKEV